MSKMSYRELNRHLQEKKEEYKDTKVESIINKYDYMRNYYGNDEEDLKIKNKNTDELDNLEYSFNEFKREINNVLAEEELMNHDRKTLLKVKEIIEEFDEYFIRFLEGNMGLKECITIAEILELMYEIKHLLGSLSQKAYEVEEQYSCIIFFLFRAIGIEIEALYSKEEEISIGAILEKIIFEDSCNFIWQPRKLW